MSRRSGADLRAVAAQLAFRWPTIKYYLREGLLHEGVRTSATQAQYDETHVARLAPDPRPGRAGRVSIAGCTRCCDTIERPAGVDARPARRGAGADRPATQAAELILITTGARR